MCNVTRLSLEQKQQVAVLLGLVIARKKPFLDVGGIIKMACYLFALWFIPSQRPGGLMEITGKLTSSSAMRF
jgi:hypothetical protein